MTRKMMLIAGVAGLALTAPATAEKGGRDKEENQQQAQAQKGGGERAERPQRQERQQVQRAERPQRAERQMQRMERPQRAERQMQRMERPQRAERQMQRMERPQRAEWQQARQVERPQRIDRREMRRVERPQRIERQQARQIERPQRIERREMRRAEHPQRIERQEARQVERADRPFRQLQREERREIKQARRDNRQAFSATPRVERQQSQFSRLVKRRDMRPMRDLAPQPISIGERIAATAFAPVPTMYASRYADTPDYYYRYNDDYGTVYRVNRDNNYVSALMPMFGGYSIGDPWPSMYQSSYVPYGYQAQYYDTPDYYYRNDGYGIYQMDGGTQLITALVALLTGQNFGIGQMMPASFGAYNVPMAYRSNYYDTDDSWYRYGDGYIYQVDPYSRRIEERYPLYADNYMVGQPWPVAYPGYNVPYGYRDAYYDTPQHHYRYANNGIYQVDPTTQLITALVALVSGQQFGVGQAMPAGYSTYNVPYDYRDRFAESNDEWYRYANGYVYRVDPRSGLIEEEYPIYA